MRKERVGFAMCGSFCTHEKALEALRELTEIYETVIPILSETAAETDSRFGNAEELLRKVQACQFVHAHGDQVCPANWKPGAETLKPSLDLVGQL